MAAAPEEELARACAAFVGENLLELAEAVATALGEAVPLRIDWAHVASAAAVARVGAFIGNELVPALSWLRPADRRLLLHRIDRIDIRFAVSARGRVIRCINEALVVGLPPDAVVPEWSAAMLCRLLELDLDAELAPVLAHVQSRAASWQERCGGGRWVVDWIGFSGHSDPQQTVFALRRLAEFLDRLGHALGRVPGPLAGVVLTSAAGSRGQLLPGDKGYTVLWDLDLAGPLPDVSSLSVPVRGA